MLQYKIDTFKYKYAQSMSSFPFIFYFISIDYK